MEYARLGTTGMQVSRLALGCMTYGDPARGNHAWSLPEEESREVIRYALDQGVTVLDTANVYSGGSSEEIVGRAVRDFASRDDVVVATKVSMRVRPGPNGAGLSRRAIMAEVDHSLRRLGLDHVDLLQVHRFDPDTPLEETLEALHDVVRAGKARYLGASSMRAWQFAKALYLAQANGWTRFVSMQNHYNLLYREEEREMLPLCKAEGIGVLPYSPLARGRLTRDFDATSDRSGQDRQWAALYHSSDQHVASVVARVAEQRGVPRAQVALAWVMRNPVITSPIVGVRTKAHLDDALAAMELQLSGDEVAVLEGAYRPQAVRGLR